MELYQLKYFLYASKYENISKAAQELRVAQPSISKAIRSLEKELQVQLFERNGKRIELTYSGRMLRESISPVLWRLEELPDELRRMGKEMDTIKLNAVSAVPLLADIIKRFKQEEPNVMFVVTDQREKTDWDVCICSAEPDQTYTYGEELLKEKVFLGVSRQSWLSGKKGVSLEELKKEDFIMLLKGTVLRKLADVRFRQYHFLPKIVMECDSTQLAWQLVSNGMGVTLWPEHSWGKNEEVNLVEILEPGFFRSIFLLHQRFGEMSPMAWRFSEYVIEYMNELEKKTAVM
ncbi:MAG: LysR family transcriptional regulator [Hungatella sp.]|nr:LysR family transcriptional regulator [Hungatella sp.]